MLMDEDLRELRVIANTLADAAGTEAMKWFRQAGLETQNKDETGFDPVTHADRNAEAAMRRILAVSRPDDGIFGEEEGQTSGTTGLTWVLDPIDGTRAFISGLPTWGILIALDDGSRGRIGIIDQPFTGERYCGTLAEPSSATLSRAGEERAISTRPCTGLSEATLMTTSPDLFEDGEMPAFAAVRDQSRLIRYGTDCYAYAMLALGQIDIVIETGLKAYDIAAPMALVQAAGGVVSDWKGRDCRWGGRTLAAGDPRVHEAALEILSRVPES